MKQAPGRVSALATADTLADCARRTFRYTVLLALVALAELPACEKERRAAPDVPFRAEVPSATRATLRNPDVPAAARLQAAAVALALYCQSLGKTWPGYSYGGAWLPGEVRELGSMVSCSDGAAQVYQGGREREHGYLLKQVAPNGPTGSRWELSRLTEDGALPILTVTLPRQAHLDLAEIVRRARPEYDRRVAANPQELRVHQDRALFLLTFPFDHQLTGEPPEQARELMAHRQRLSARRADARAALLDSAARLPNHFWPQLMLALLDASGGAASAAPAGLLAWVEQRQSFSALAHLAQFYRLTAQVSESCATMQRALQLPLREEPGDLLNGSALGYEIAAAAYRAQRYGCAEQLARTLRDKEVDRYTRERFELALRGLQAAAAWMQGRRDEARALVHSDGLVEKDPFYRDQEAALPKLAQAIQRGDSAVLRSWRPAHTGQFEQAAFSSLDLPGLLGLRQ